MAVSVSGWDVRHVEILNRNGRKTGLVGMKLSLKDTSIRCSNMDMRLTRPKRSQTVYYSIGGRRMSSSRSSERPSFQSLLRFIVPRRLGFRRCTTKLRLCINDVFQDTLDDEDVGRLFFDWFAT